jgi:hypothetical protein
MKLIEWEGRIVIDPTNDFDPSDLNGRTSSEVVADLVAPARRELHTYLQFYNHDRVHHGRLTRGQIPADLVYRARKMEAR